MKKPHYNINIILTLLGLISFFIYIYFTLVQSDTQKITEYIVVYFLAYAILLITYLLIKKNWEHTEKGSQFFQIVLIISFGILFRFALFPTTTSTSDDVNRYLWEGKLIANGENPFEKSPDDSTLVYLHSKDLPAKVSFKNMTTIYPPLAQLIFYSGYLISGESDLGLKFIYILFELLSLIILYKLLLIKKKKPYNIIWYAWLPLPIMEYFINSHIDVVGITFFLLFIYYFYKKNVYLFSTALSFAILVKLTPLMFLPIVFKHSDKKDFLKIILILSILLSAFILPFLPEQRSIAESLNTYLGNWSFNGSMYQLLVLLQLNDIARMICLILFASIVLFISFKSKSFLNSIFLIWIAFICFTPTIYPWYLGWAAVLNPVLMFNSILWLLFSINLTNLTPLSTIWKEYWWVLLIEYLPFYYLLQLEVRKMFSKTKT